MPVNSLIVGLNSGINIASIIRTNYVLGGGAVLYIYDPRNVLKESREEIDTFSCGLSERISYSPVNDIEEFLKQYKGRKISTELSSDAVTLPKFKFRKDDIILFGNEIDGLPSSLSKMSDQSVIIPMQGDPFVKSNYDPQVRPIRGMGEYPTYNVAVSYAIVMYTALEQMGLFRNWKFNVTEKPED